MTPQLWLELSPSHIRHAQLAAVRQIPQGMTDAALLLHRSHVLPCRFGAACLPVAWCHGWVGWGANIFCRFSFQGGCIRSQLRSRLPDGGRMSSGSVAYSRWVQAPCRHSLNLQRGQHAGAGLGTGPHDPSGGQHDAVRCWLGLGSNDPLRCGLNSAHPTFAQPQPHVSCQVWLKPRSTPLHVSKEGGYHRR